MRARLRGPGGASTISLADDATVGDLIAQIIEKTSISSFDVKYGYPPKPLFLKQSEKSRPLKELDVKLDGEQITISPTEQPVVQQSSQGDSKEKATLKSQNEGLSPVPVPPEGGKQKRPAGPVSLQRKGMAGDVPELPLPERGATLGKFLVPFYTTSAHASSAPRDARRQQLSLPGPRRRRPTRGRPQHARAALPGREHHPGRA
jgi:ubiquitin thioesterase OTU1